MRWSPSARRWKRPRCSWASTTRAAAIDARRQEAEGLRGYFEAQLAFAQIIADRRSRPLAQTCLEVTNLHRRFGLGRIEGGVPSAAWGRYAEGLERCASGPERLDWTVAFFAGLPPEVSTSRRFGCFSYELQDDGPVVRIHFANRDSADGQGPLARVKIAQRLADLGQMFGHVRAEHPGARAVRGGSWLYNLEAYRRLFPPEYGASRAVLEPVRLDGTSSWGQLLDFRGAVKPPVRAALLESAGQVDPSAPWRAFPLRALRVQSAIDPFYRLYGV